MSAGWLGSKLQGPELRGGDAGCFPEGPCPDQDAVRGECRPSTPGGPWPHLPRARLGAAASGRSSCLPRGPRGHCLALHYTLSTTVLENTRRPDCPERPPKAGTLFPHFCPDLLGWHPLQNSPGALAVQRKGQMKSVWRRGFSFALQSAFSPLQSARGWGKVGVW